MLSKVSKLKVSNRSNKREVRQLTERERERGQGGWGWQRVKFCLTTKNTESCVLLDSNVWLVVYFEQLRVSSWEENATNQLPAANVGLKY